MSDLQLPINPVAMPALGRDPAELARRIGAADHPAAMQAAKDFESVLLNKLMEAMQRTIPESGLLGNGITKQVQGLFWYYLSQEVADAGGTGLWRDIYRDITGAAPPPDASSVEHRR